MKRVGLILMAGLALGGATPARAQETDEAERLPTAQLSIEDAGRLLTTARAAYEDGLFRLAQRRLEELVAGAPDKRRQAEGALWLARVLLAKQEPAAALAVLDARREQVRAAALIADFAVARARALFDLGRPVEGAAELEVFREKYASQDSAPGALRLLVRILAAQGKWQEAEETCRELAARHPAHPDAPAAWLDLATDLAASNRADKARAMLMQLETNYAGQVWSERATLKIAELQMARGEQAPALQRLQALAENTNLLAETRAQGFRIVAQALGAASNYPAALRLANRSIAATADPAQRLESEVVKARLLLRAGRTGEGAELMRSVAARLPDETRAARLQLDLAGELARLEQWEAAAAEYQAWLDAFDGLPGTVDALAGRGWALWSASRHDEAAQMYARAAAAESDPARRLPLLQKEADAEFASRRYTEAQAAYAAVLAAAPPESDLAGRARLQLAEAELALGETEAGEIRLLELSREKKETEFTRAATMRLGALYEERGALETAMEQYGRIIAACSVPEPCAQALLARGLVHYRMGAFQLALDDFSRIRDEFSRTAPAAQAMFMRGWCLYLLGKDAEALKACEQFLEDDPRSEFAQDVRFWLGEHAFNHGEYDKAEQRFAALAADHPEGPRAGDALYWAGRAATARREYLAANEHYNGLMARYPEHPRLAETLLAQGDVLSELGQFAAAILAFNEVIVKFPQAPEAVVAWGRKGDCQYTLGQENPARYEEALLSYRTLLDFAGAPVDLRLQAGFKIGRCLEKMGRAAAALDRYMEVVYSFLQESQPSAEANVWFTRAAFAAAALQENAGKWREAVGIYNRVAGSGTPAAAEARARLERIRQEHWTLF